MEDEYVRNNLNRYFIIEDYIAIPIHSIKLEDYDGFVYNIETEDNTFMTSVITHNSAGYDVSKMTKEQLIPFTQYAAATQSDLAISTESILTTLKSYNMDISEAAEVTDIFTQSIISSFLTMETLKDGMSYVGPIAGTLGITLDETVASLAALSDRGMQGGMAGQRLTMIFTQLLSPTARATEMLDAMGLSMAELDPRTHTLTEILLKLQAANFSAAEASEMFRTRTAGAATVLVENAQEVGRLADTYRSAIGVTEAVADAQQTTLWAALKRTTNAVTEQATVIGNDLKPLFESLATGTMQMALVSMNALGAVVKAVADNWSWFSNVLKVLIPILLTTIALYKLETAAIAKDTLAKVALGTTTGYNILMQKLHNIQMKFGVLWNVISLRSTKALIAARIAEAAATGLVSKSLLKLKVAMLSIPILGWIAMLTTLVVTLEQLGAFEGIKAWLGVDKKAEESYIRLGDVISDLDVKSNEFIANTIKGFSNLKISLDKVKMGASLSEAIVDSESLLDSFKNLLDVGAGKRETAAGIVWDALSKDVDKYKDKIIEVINLQVEGRKAYATPEMFAAAPSGFMKAYKDWVLEGTKSQNKLIDMFDEIAGITSSIIAISLVDEYLKTAKAVKQLTSVEEDRLTAEYALNLYLGKQLPLLDGVANKEKIIADARALVTTYTNEYNNALKITTALTENYLNAQKNSVNTNREVTAGINSMLTAIRSINIARKDLTDEEGKAIEGGSLDEWVAVLEEIATVQSDVSINTEKLNTLMANQSVVAEELAQKILEYGADSLEAKNAQSELNRVIEERVSIEAAIAEADAKRIASETLIASVLKDEVEAEKQLHETEKLLLGVAQQLITLREAETSALTDKYKAQAKIDALRYIEINFTKIYSEKLKNYFEAQQKIFDIEEKLYKLRVSEDEQQESLFEKLAEQGMLTEEMIQLYIALQEAQGEIMALTYDFTQAYGGLTEEQRAVVDGYMLGTKTLQDLYDAGITNVDIFVQMKAAQDALTAATKNFNDQIIPLIQHLVDIGLVTAEAAKAFFDLISRTNDTAQANWDLAQSYQGLLDSMGNMISTNITLLQSLITDPTQDAASQIDELLVKLGLIPEGLSESERQAQALALMNSLYGTTNDSLDDFSQEQLVVAATLLDVADNIGIYTKDMSLMQIAAALGFDSLTDLNNIASTSFANTDTFAKATEDLATAAKAFKDAAVELVDAFTKMQILSTLGIGEGGAEAIALMLRLNFSEAVKTFGGDLDLLLSTLADEDFSFDFSFTSSWDDEDWDTFVNSMGPKTKEIIAAINKAVPTLDIKETWTGKDWKDHEGDLQANLGTINRIFSGYQLFLNFDSKWDKLDWSSFISQVQTNTGNLKSQIEGMATKLGITIDWDKEGSFESFVSNLSATDLQTFIGVVKENGATLPIDVDETAFTTFTTLLAGYDPATETITYDTNTDAWIITKNDIDTEINKDHIIDIDIKPTTKKEWWDGIWTQISGFFDYFKGLFGVHAMGGIVGLQKGAMVKGPQMALVGEAGPEAIIPLEGMNKKYGEELLKYIIPKYYPDLLKLQTGGMVGGGRSVSYGGDTNQNENFSIMGPIYVQGVADENDFVEKLRFKMRSSR
ncbi:MAG: phage tail tape measure protein [Actinobacteria bacterium]|nr:phage tail tape measure protein [Actinomycetota bacterium]